MPIYYSNKPASYTGVFNHWVLTPDHADWRIVSLWDYRKGGKTNYFFITGFSSGHSFEIVHWWDPTGHETLLSILSQYCDQTCYVNFQTYFDCGWLGLLEISYEILVSWILYAYSSWSIHVTISVVLIWNTHAAKQFQLMVPVNNLCVACVTSHGLRHLQHMGCSWLSRLP